MSTVMLSLGGELGEGAGQSSWSGRPPKARPKMPRGRCPVHLRPPGRCKGWRGSSPFPLGTSASSAPERPLSCLALSREIRVTHRPGVPAPASLSSCWANHLSLGRCPGARAQEGSSGSGLPFHPGQVWTGQAHGESLLRAHRGDSVGKRVNLPLHATPSGP